MNSEYDSCSIEVWVVCCELLGDVLVGLQGPDSVMSTAIQLVYLRKINNMKTTENQERRNEREENTMWDIRLPLGATLGLPDTSHCLGRTG